ILSAGFRIVRNCVVTLAPSLLSLPFVATKHVDPFAALRARTETMHRTSASRPFVSRCIETQAALSPSLMDNRNGGAPSSMRQHLVWKANRADWQQLECLQKQLLSALRAKTGKRLTHNNGLRQPGFESPWGRHGLRPYPFTG